MELTSAYHVLPGSHLKDKPIAMPYTRYDTVAHGKGRIEETVYATSKAQAAELFKDKKNITRKIFWKD